SSLGSDLRVRGSDTEATLDGNHPLAGLTVQLRCAVADVREATENEIAHGHVYGRARITTRIRVQDQIPRRACHSHDRVIVRDFLCPYSEGGSAPRELTNGSRTEFAAGDAAHPRAGPRTGGAACGFRSHFGLQLNA